MTMLLLPSSSSSRRTRFVVGYLIVAPFLISWFDISMKTTVVSAFSIVNQHFSGVLVQRQEGRRQQQQQQQRYDGRLSLLSKMDDLDRIVSSISESNLATNLGSAAATTSGGVGNIPPSMMSNKDGMTTGSSSFPPMMNLRTPLVGRGAPGSGQGAGGQAPEYYEGAKLGPPPDLPSLLLHNRIVYIGMPLVPAVTELIIAELLYLNYESTTKPITMYINSPGTTTASGQSVGYETEAFAIADVMKYVKPPVHTCALGQAFGAAAMLLSQGKRGNRFALPNATILLNQPRSMARGQASDIAIKAREVASNRRKTCELLATACGKPLNVVMDDCARVKYLQPEEAVEYGLIDEVIRTESLAVKPSFVKSL